MRFEKTGETWFPHSFSFQSFLYIEKNSNFFCFFHRNCRKNEVASQAIVQQKDKKKTANNIRAKSAPTFKRDLIKNIYPHLLIIIIFFVIFCLWDRLAAIRKCLSCFELRFEEKEGGGRGLEGEGINKYCSCTGDQFFLFLFHSFFFLLLLGRSFSENLCWLFYPC